MPSTYSIFRYQSTSVVAWNMHQLAELEFFGTAAQVPEPASLLLMGLGALGFAARRKRRA